MRFTLDDLISLTGARVVRWPSEQPVRPNHDHLAITPGELFVPMRRGSVTDSVAAHLAKVGAAGLVIFTGQTAPSASRYPNLGVLVMESPSEQYLRLAAVARERNPGLVVGVTGSSGKSSTKEFMAGILATRHRVQATWRSRNLVSDCAGVLLRMDGPGESAVIEMAFGAPGHIIQMTEIARPAFGIITKITAEHLMEAGGTLEGLVREKSQLGHGLPPDGILALHAEDPGCAMIDRSAIRCRVMTFGLSNRADLQISDILAEETGTTVTFRFSGQRMRCRLQLCGSFQAHNAAAAALIGHVAGFSPADIQQGLEQTAPSPRRFLIHRFGQGLTVVNDTFSANIDNALRGLEEARALAKGRRLVALLGGGMTAVGNQTLDHMRELGEHAVACGFRELYLVDSEGIELIARGAMAAGLAAEHIHQVESPVAVADALLPALGRETVLYCKGGHYLNLRPGVEALLKALPGAGFDPLP